MLARVATGKNGLILEQLQPADARVHFCGDDGLPRHGSRPFFLEPSLVLGVVDRERRELFANLFLDRFLFGFLLRREQRQLRFGRVVHERHQLVVRPVRYRVELVRMTLCTAQREAKPGGAGGVDAINHRVESKLERINASLLVDHRVAMKTSGHALRQCGARQHVAGDLFDGELIERHVVVDGADHPVSPRPDGSRAILLITVRVGITREVEPRRRPMLAVLRPVEQSIHQSLVGIRPCVLHEFPNLARRGRQADEIERQATNQPVTIGLN